MNRIVKNIREALTAKDIAAYFGVFIEQAKTGQAVNQKELNKLVTDTIRKTAEPKAESGNSLLEAYALPGHVFESLFTDEQKEQIRQAALKSLEGKPIRNIKVRFLNPADNSYQSVPIDGEVFVATARRMTDAEVAQMYGMPVEKVVDVWNQLRGFEISPFELAKKNATGVEAVIGPRGRVADMERATQRDPNRLGPPLTPSAWAMEGHIDTTFDNRGGKAPQRRSSKPRHPGAEAKLAQTGEAKPGRPTMKRASRLLPRKPEDK